MNTFASWSGGKDSMLACYRTIKLGYKVTYLLNMISEDGKYSRSHGISADLLRLQAQAINIPILQNGSSRENYEREFKRSIFDLKEKNIKIGVFGDIDLQEHRDWVERVCAETGIKPVFPLWLEERESLILEFIGCNFVAVVVATNSKFLGKEWLGRKIDKEFVNEIKSLGNIDLCGENGEYHTLVIDGPIFREPLRVSFGEKMFRDGHWFLKIKNVADP